MSPEHNFGVATLPVGALYLQGALLRPQAFSLPPRAPTSHLRLPLTGPKIEKIQSRLKFSIPLEIFNLA